ncbi:MAG: tetratricopeptide repeat protein [Oscillochloridaceae bacterium umkhey_bin13]
MADPHRLVLLARLRTEARVTLAQMARVCGLAGARAYESASAWERGASVPHRRLRPGFISYLADTLGLARDPDQLAAVWAILVEQWGWEPLTTDEWQRITTTNTVDSPLAAPPSPRQDPHDRQQLPLPGPLPPGSWLPIPPNPAFVGRERELQILARLFEVPAMPLPARRGQVIVTGPGGIGKTQLVVEFAHRYGNCFPGGIFWLSFAHAEAIPAAVAACGLGLGLGHTFERMPLHEQVALVQAAWDQPQPRLLIFDNCETASLLRTWLPQQGGCHILVTSRRATSDAELGLISLPLGRLSRKASVALLRQLCPLTQLYEADLIALAAELDDLPLALYLAGSHLARSAGLLTPGQYRAALSQTRAVGETTPRLDNQPNQFSQTVALSLGQLKPHDPDDQTAYALVLRAAWLAPGEPIPLSLLATTLPEPAVALVLALERLETLGLVLPGATAHGQLRLHHLVCARLRSEAGASAAQQATETALLSHMRALNALLDQPSLLAIQVHLRAVTDQALLRHDALAADLSYELSRHLGEIEVYPEALSYLQRSHQIREQLFGPTALCCAENLHYMGELLEWMGEYPGARPYHEHGLAIRLHHLGRDHLATATSMLHCGEIAHALVDYSAAHQHYEAALAIRIQHLGADSPAAAELYNNLGLLLNALGEWETALPYAKQAVAIWEAQAQPNRSRQAMAINNLGYLRRVRGEYSLALVELRRALAIREQIYGPYNSFIGVTRNHLGRIYHYQGQFAQAEAELQATLALLIKAIGLEHPITACTLSNLGMLMLDLGDSATARHQVEQALEIHRRLLGPTHRHTAHGLNRLGLILLAQGAFTAAAHTLEAALVIRRRLFGDMHPATANMLGHLGLVYLKQSQLDAARPLLAQALHCHQARLGERHPYTARSLLRMGQVCAALGEQAISGDYLNRALSVYTAVLGADHPYTLAAWQAKDAAG